MPRPLTVTSCRHSLSATGASTIPEMTKHPRHTGWVDAYPTKAKASWLTVRTDGFVAHETRCSVVQAAADKNSNFLVKFRCSGEGQTWTRLQFVMQETEREP